MQTSRFFVQFVDTLVALPDAWRLIRERRLWRGLGSYGWLARVLLLVAILLGLSFVGLVLDWFQSLRTIDSPLSAFSSVGNLVSNMAVSGYESFTSGLMKYVVLLCAEVLIYHFMQRTLQELRDKPLSTRFQDFLDAQVRMFKVIMRVWVLELLVTIAVSVVFGIFGFLSWLEPALLFVVQCYFFGLIILDNYFEQHDLSIKESMAQCQRYMGISLALGIILYLAMLVPLVGAIAGTILVSVMAVIVLNQWTDGTALPEEVQLA